MCSARSTNLTNGRATLISALAIPTSIVAGFGVMWVANLSLNIISLVALALAVRIVIEDAIIVVESIFHRRLFCLPAISGIRAEGIVDIVHGHAAFAHGGGAALY